MRSLVKLLICKERDYERNRNACAILDHGFYDRCDGCNGFSNLERLNKERDMIRFVTGLLVVMGAMGGMEVDGSSVFVGTAIAALGLLMMAWPIVDGTVQRND